MSKKILKNAIVFVVSAIFLALYAIIYTHPGRVSAARNQEIKFQGKIVNKTIGTNISPSCIVSGVGNDTCDFKLTVYDASSGGNALWSEVQSNVEIGEYDGVFSFNIGSYCITNLGGSWTVDGDGAGGACSVASGGVVWAAGIDHYLQIDFDDDGNGDFVSAETFSRSKLTNVPYAFYADEAGSIAGLASTDFVQFRPSSAQSSGNTSNALIWLNEDGTGTPNLMELEVGGVDKFVVNNSGNLTANAIETTSGAITSASSVLTFNDLYTGDIAFSDATYTTLPVGYNSIMHALSAASSGGSLFTDGGTLTYLTSTTDDFAIGGSALASAFSVDVDTNTIRIGTGATANAVLGMYASDGDTATIEYTTNDSFYFNGGSVGIGTNTPNATLGVVNDTETTGNVVGVSADGLTTGTGVVVESTSGIVSSGDVMQILHNATYTSTVSHSGNVIHAQRDITLNHSSPGGGGISRDANLSDGEVASSTALSFSHTVSSASNRILVVGITLGANVAVTGATYGGTPLTLAIMDQAGFNQNKAYIYYMVNPPAGTDTISITTGGSTRISAFATNYINIDTADPIDQAVEAANPNWDSISLTITGAIAGQMIVDVYGVDPSENPTGGQTEIHTGNYIISSELVAVTGNNAIGYTDSVYPVLAAITLNPSGETPADFEMTGPLAYFTSNCTQTSGLCGDSSSLLYLEQQFTEASGDVLTISNAGGGYAALFDTSNLTGNGVLIGIDSSADTEDAFKVVTGNSTIDAFVIKGDGSVAIGTDITTASLLTIAAPTTSGAQINLVPSSSVNPTTPNNGDLWYNGTNLYFYNGTTSTDLLVGGAVYWSRDSVNGYTYSTTSADLIGIGTNVPAGKLHISGSADDELLILRGHSTQTAPYLLAQVNAGTELFRVDSDNISNFFAGYEAGNANTYSALNSGGQNTFVGGYAGRLNTTGYSNTAFGYVAFDANTTGYSNTAIGSISLSANTTGHHNTAVGDGSMSFNTIGTANVAIGSYAMNANTSGSNNTGLGNNALFANTLGNYNTALGAQALDSSIDGLNNTAIGFNAGHAVTTGDNNIFLGYLAGSNMTSGSSNIIIGASTTAPVATGSNQLNIGGLIYGDTSTSVLSIGTQVGASRLKIAANTTGLSQINLTASSAIDVSSPLNGDLWYNGTNLYFYDGSSNTDLLAGGVTFWSRDAVNGYTYATTSSDRIGIGTATPAGKLQIVGDSAVSQLLINAHSTQTSATPIIKINDSSGTEMFRIHSDSYSNVFFGLMSGNANTPGSGDSGMFNTFLGSSSGRLNLGGKFNTAVGALSLYNNLYGYGNTAIGGYALFTNESGYSNVVLGNSALYNNVSGDNNVAIGSVAGYFATGNNNIFLGYQAGDALTTGNNNIVIGYNIDLPAVDSANMLNIGNLIYATGLDGTGTTISTGKVGIGTASPDYTLELSGATAPKFALGDTGLTHGITTYAQTDSFFSVDQVTDDDGGARIWGFSDAVGVTPLRLVGNFGSLDPTDTVPAIWIVGGKRLDTGITYLADAETLFAVSNNGADKLTILGDGKVGIGTTTPGSLLEVVHASSSNIKIKTTTTGATNVSYLILDRADQANGYAGIVFQTAGSNSWVLNMIGGSNDLRLYDYGGTPGERFRFQSSTGYLGLTNSSPSAMIDIGGTANTNTAGDGHKLRISANTTGLFGFRMDSGNANLVLDKYWSSWIPALSIGRSSGYLGVGTVSPGSSLHVEGTSQSVAAFDTTGTRAGQIQIDGGSGASGRGGGILFGAYGDVFANIRGYILDSSNYGTGDLIFGTRTASTNTTLTEVMRITSAKRVGIGTTSPGTALEVAETTAYLTLNSTHSGDSSAGVIFEEDSVKSWSLYNADSNSVLYALDADSTHGAYLSQNVSGWTSYSDIRLKSDIIDETNILDRINNIRTVSYYLNGGPNREIGVIAQEILPYFPEIVNEDSEYLGVIYERIGVIALGGVKELNTVVEEEKVKLADLDTSMKNQELRIASLEGDVVAIKSDLDQYKSIMTNNSGVLVVNAKISAVAGINIQKSLALSDDISNLATITTGSTEISVEFPVPKTSVPSIQLTPVGFFGNYRVKEVTNTGFIIEIDQINDVDTNFYWLIVDKI